MKQLRQRAIRDLQGSAHAIAAAPRGAPGTGTDRPRAGGAFDTLKRAGLPYVSAELQVARGRDA